MGSKAGSQPGQKGASWSVEGNQGQDRPGLARAERKADGSSHWDSTASPPNLKP